MWRTLGLGVWEQPRPSHHIHTLPHHHHTHSHTLTQSHTGMSSTVLLVAHSHAGGQATAPGAVALKRGRPAGGEGWSQAELQAAVTVRNAGGTWAEAAEAANAVRRAQGGVPRAVTPAAARHHVLKHAQAQGG